jgi:hypothetical protein
MFLLAWVRAEALQKRVLRLGMTFAVAFSVAFGPCFVTSSCLTRSQFRVSQARGLLG